MISREWLTATKDVVEGWAGRLCGIAYTQTFFRDPQQVWYDRLGTEVPSYIAAGLAKLNVDCVFLNVEQVLELALLSERREKLSAVFNVCLGHRSLDNWVLIPSVCSWVGLPVLPNGAHTTLLGEDKLAAKGFATAAGLETAETWAQRIGGSGLYVSKPRGWGSSVGLALTDVAVATGDGHIVEPFVPGGDLTVVLLHDASRGRLACLGAMYLDHHSDTPEGSLWTEAKKSPGELNDRIDRTYHAIAADLEQALLSMADSLGARSAVRVDFRMPRPPESAEIGLSDVVFLEINPCPTPAASSSIGRMAQWALAHAPAGHVPWTEQDGDAFAIASLLCSVSAR
jgi:D-alanine-D-alanine ligase-like ATP-grasp enzyme